MYRRSVTMRGISIPYIEIGAKSEHEKTVVIVHGAWFNSDCMVEYAQALNRKHVIIMDLPYHETGKITYPISEKITGDGYASIIATAIRTLIRDGDITEKPEYHGWSLGGTTGLNIAIKYPALLGELVLLASGPTWKQMSLPLLQNNFLKDMMCLAVLVQLKSKKVKLAVPLRIFKDKKHFFANYRACNNDTRIITQLDVTDDLYEINIPVYTVRMEGDTLVDPDNQQVMISSIPNNKDVLVPGYGHMMVIEEPVKFAQIVKQLTNK